MKGRCLEFPIVDPKWHIWLRTTSDRERRDKELT